MEFEYVLFAVLAVFLVGAALKWSVAGKKSKSRPSRSASARQSELSGRGHSSHRRTQDPNSVSELPSLLVGSGDPIADASLNLKYGRTAQAVYILKEAFKAEPPNMDVGMKLAEILLSTNDIKEFNKLEARFKELTGEEGPFWEALKILKSDNLGVAEEQDRSTYTDFGVTEISNLKGQVKKSGPHMMSRPSQQY